MSMLVGEGIPFAQGYTNSFCYCKKKDKIIDYILLGVGESQAKGNTRPSLVSDVFEALIAAIYLELGLEEAEKFVMKLIKRYLDGRINPYWHKINNSME